MVDIGGNFGDLEKPFYEREASYRLVAFKQVFEGLDCLSLRGTSGRRADENVRIRVKCWHGVTWLL